MYAIKLDIEQVPLTVKLLCNHTYLFIISSLLFIFLKFIVSIYLYLIGFLKDLIDVEPSLNVIHNIFQALIVRGKCRKS